jgi:hypothetical protein
MVAFGTTMATQIRINNYARHIHTGALVDGGTNGGMFGSDVRILEESDATCDVHGIGHNTISNLRIVTGAGNV